MATPPSPTPELCTALIVGTGFSGLAMAHALKRAGIDDIVLLERASAVGGTWRDNRYPGCACDVPSHLYSLSVAPNAAWSHRYARQPEIRAYLEGFTVDEDLARHIRFDADVDHARFDAQTGRWTVTTTDGRRFDARFFIAGVGGLKDPRYPDIPGMDRFEGTALHSARWDPDVDLACKRVAVVGTGASAIQLVPALAPIARQLTVFQRTPAWVLPRDDRPISVLQQALLGGIPGLMPLVRLYTYLQMESRYFAVFRRRSLVRRGIEALVRRHIRQHVPDAALAERLLPSYAMGCKRILVSDDWYPAMARDNVDLMDQSVVEVLPHGLRTADGQEHPVDAIVWCTGFLVDEPLGEMKIEGLDGQDLLTVWDGRPKGWLGITMAGFPNAFLLLGPNTALGHNSVVIMIEAQVRYIVQAIEWTRKLSETAWIDVDSAAVDRFVDDIDRAHSAQVWQSGCQSWYLNAAGQNFTLWPGSTLSYMWATRRFDPLVYRVG